MNNSNNFINTHSLTNQAPRVNTNITSPSDLIDEIQEIQENFLESSNSPKHSDNINSNEITSTVQIFMNKEFTESSDSLTSKAPYSQDEPPLKSPKETFQKNTEDFFSELNKNVSITSCFEAGKWVQHTEYIIEYEDFQKIFSTKRRYKEFRKLHLLLQKLIKTMNLTNISLPELPPSKFFHRMNPSFIQSRKSHLLSYLRTLMGIQNSTLNMEILHFLSVDSISLITHRIFLWRSESNIDDLLTEFTKEFNSNKKAFNRFLNPYVYRSMMEMKPKSFAMKDSIIKLFSKIVDSNQDITTMIIENNYLYQFFSWILEINPGSYETEHDLIQKFCLYFVKTNPISFINLLSEPAGEKLLEKFLEKEFIEYYHDFLSHILWFTYHNIEVQPIFQKSKPFFSILTMSTRPITLFLMGLITLSLMTFKLHDLEYITKDIETILEDIFVQLCKSKLSQQDLFYFMNFLTQSITEYKTSKSQSSEFENYTLSFLSLCSHYVLSSTINDIGLNFIEKQITQERDRVQSEKDLFDKNSRSQVFVPFVEYNKLDTDGNTNNERTSLSALFQTHFEQNNTDFKQILTTFKKLDLSSLAYSQIIKKNPDSSIEKYLIYLLLLLPYEPDLDTSDPIFSKAEEFQPSDYFYQTSNVTSYETNYSENTFVGGYSKETSSNLSTNYHSSSYVPSAQHMNNILENFSLRLSIIDQFNNLIDSMLKQHQSTLDEKQQTFNSINKKIFELDLDSTEKNVINKNLSKFYSELLSTYERIKKAMNELSQLIIVHIKYNKNISDSITKLTESKKLLFQKYELFSPIMKSWDESIQLIRELSAEIESLTKELEPKQDMFDALQNKLREDSAELNASYSSVHYLRIEWHNTNLHFHSNNMKSDKIKQEIFEMMKESDNLKQMISEYERGQHGDFSPYAGFMIEDHYAKKFQHEHETWDIQTLKSQLESVELECTLKNKELELINNNEELKSKLDNILSKIRSLDIEQSNINLRAIQTQEEKNSLGEEIKTENLKIHKKEMELFSQKKLQLQKQARFNSQIPIFKVEIENIEKEMKAIFTLLEVLLIKVQNIDTQIVVAQNALEDQKVQIIELKKQIEDLTNSLYSINKKIYIPA